MPWTTLIPVLAALAGAFVGGLIAETRTVLETRRERRKALNRVLWTQLDVWYQVERSDPSAFIDIFLSGLRKRLPITDEQFGELMQQKGIMSAMLQQTFLSGDLNEQLEAEYSRAVNALADFDPMLAFRLSGKSVLTRHREQSDSYLEKVLEHYGHLDAAFNKLEMMRPFLHQEGFESARRTFESDIKDVAGQLGRGARKRVSQLLEDLKLRAEKEQSSELEAYMDRSAEQILALATDQSDSDPNYEDHA